MKRVLIVSLTASLLVACAGTQTQTVESGSPGASINEGSTDSLDTASSDSQRATIEPGSTGASLYEGFDGYARSMDAANADAQEWFDQGMQFLHGFNHAEAIRAFQEAAARDPDNPMPWWGIAHASGININDPMMEEDEWVRADHAATEAM